MKKLAGFAVFVIVAQLAFAPQAAALGQLNGSGSTYVGLAMSDWQNGAGSRGIPVNYSALGSPAGVNQYGDRTVDFGGTEAEVSSLQAAGGGGISAAARGYQYVPDVAGAVAVMYNVSDAAGRRVTTLHLTRATIARIFARSITRWSDPAITATNGGFALPDQPITLIGRGGQSGTTALFYDFVAHMAPDAYNQFIARNVAEIGNLSAGVRPIQLPTSGQDGTAYRLFADSDQIAQTVANGSVPFSIGYDEFGYAKKYNAPTVWVENQSGGYTQPYAQNISAALTRANLRPDLSQELSGVYTNSDPLTYPISAYSYLMMPCSGGRDTCKGGYGDQGKTDTAAAFVSHVACDGQINMARIGYSPLPPNLSQEMMNAVARLTGAPARQLNPGNCSNPTFHGSLGAGATSPPDPFEALGGVKALTHGGAGGNRPSAQAGAGGPSGATGGPSAADASLANGGSADWRDAEPAAYDRDGFGTFGPIAALVLAVTLLLPLLVRAVLRRLRRS
ncbi:substrate-binding domain-containing protein [Amycolatopsis pigmentata]|uniref:Substrate-binding domain-containing protein n=1 Tax=Amycolatopsis pigmentata TaxID=450801 RepID=A0ABW5FMT9_9PSEU